jgi:hypothetical protein
LIVGKKIKPAQRLPLVQWAARNSFDTLVFPLRDKAAWNWLSAGAGLKLVEQSGIAIEAGGWELSLLMPKRLFLLRRDIFRMDYGKRTPRYNFCSTNPKSIEILKKNAAKIFARVARKMLAASNAAPLVFHLWPDYLHEKAWCACPACRAFSPAEQNLIAVNTAASALAQLYPDARLSYLNFAEDAPGISPRGNVFAMSCEPL